MKHFRSTKLYLSRLSIVSYVPSAAAISSTTAIALKLKYLEWRDMPINMTFDIPSWTSGLCMIPKPFVAAKGRSKIVLIGSAKMLEIALILLHIFISFYHYILC